jgi:hypothetical protein
MRDIMAIASHYALTTVISTFLGGAPTLEEIVDFQLPAELEARALELLERNRQNTLSGEERAEIDEFTRMGHFMNVVKLQARMKLADKA